MQFVYYCQLFSRLLQTSHFLRDYALRKSKEIVSELSKKRQLMFLRFVTFLKSHEIITNDRNCWKSVKINKKLN